MKSGDLRRRITIQKPIPSVDREGLPTIAWQDVATVHAAVEPINGREFFQAGAEISQISTRIRIRYLSGILPTMRVLYGMRVFNIRTSIDIDDRHREIHLMCQEVVAGA